MDALLVKAQMTGMKRRADGTVGFTFRTLEELSNEDFSLSDQYFQQSGWLAFKMNEFTGEELPEENAMVEGMKTPSQYLRSCLFSKFRAMGGTKDEFPAYYNRVMAGFADSVNKSHPGRGGE